MPPYIDQSFEEFQCRIRIDNLPPNVTARQIQDLFGRFGVINKLYLKRRVSRESSIPLPNPYVILFYERSESIDKIMANRPYFMNNHELFVHRCLPTTRRYPYEAYMTINKILVRIPREHHDKILPNDEIIIDYLKLTGGEILRWERLDDRTFFVEFNDYDSVDVCCLLRPHFINKQTIEIEKCSDEEQARRRVQYRQKNRPISIKKLSSNDTTIQSNETISPTQISNISEQSTQLHLMYRDMTDHIESEHEQLLSSLKNQLEQTMKERIRFQRLTVDYQQEKECLMKENRRIQKLFSESLLEKPRVLEEGQRKLNEVSEEYLKMKNLFL